MIGIGISIAIVNDVINLVPPAPPPPAPNASTESGDPWLTEGGTQVKEEG